MGEVFLAEDTRLERKVAIKVLPAKSLGDEQAKRRLIREARLAATLDHPNIRAIYEVNEEGDSAFIAMQYVEGESLSSKIKNNKLELENTISIAAQVAEALVAAHSRGIIHRDIKPENIVITPSGQVKVLDFGLAKLVQPLVTVDSKDGTLSLLTEVGTIVGTVRYMSPEQAKGEHLDARSDIFSLGALLYECVTGRPAFPGGNKMEVCGQVIHLDPPPPSQINEHVPPELDRIILRALAKRTDARYQSASELLTDLRKVRKESQEAHKERPQGIALRTGALRIEAVATLSNILGRRLPVTVGFVIVPLIAFVAAWLALHPRHSAPHQPLPDAKHWYEIGTNALRDGAYYQASKALRRAVELDDKFALAHARLAEAYAEIDYTDKAAEELLFATSLVPDHAIMATVRRDFAGAIEHYRTITEQAADSDKPTAYVDLGRSYEKNENLDKAIESYQEATKRDSQSAAAFLRLAILYGRQQNLKDATVAFNTAEKIYQDLFNQEGVTEVLYQRGTVLTKMGKLVEARAQLEKAQTSANKYQQIKILLQLSGLSWSEGNTTRAQNYAREAIDLAQANDIQSLAASGLIDLGTAFFFRGEYDEAEKYFKQALDFAKRSKARRNEARALLSLGSLNVQRRNPDEAIPYIKQALDFYQPGGYNKETSLALNLLGRASQDKGDYTAALEIFEQQLQLAKEIGDASQLALSHASIGLLLGMDQERYPEALNHFDESYKINDSLGAQLNVGYNLMNRGRLLWQLGRYQEARTALNQARSIADRPEARYKELLAWVSLSNAQIALSMRRLAEAKEKGQQALESADTQYKEIAIQAKYTLGLVKAFSGAPQAGKPLCEEAVTLARETNNPRLSSALLALAEVMLETHSAQDALTTALQAQASFARSGQQDSEWRAWLMAARASQLAGNESAITEYASRADSLFSSLRQKWGTEEYNLYSHRPDIKTYRKQINQLLAINK